jgi:hypothetical protein
MGLNEFLAHFDGWQTLTCSEVMVAIKPDWVRSKAAISLLAASFGGTANWNTYFRKPNISTVPWKSKSTLGTNARYGRKYPELSSAPPGEAAGFETDQAHMDLKDRATREAPAIASAMKTQGGIPITK